MPKEMKQLVVPFEIKEFEQDDEFFYFKGYASTFGNVDRGGDRVIAGAFAESLRDIKAAGELLPVIWQHDTRSPLGVYVEMYEDAKGLFMHGKMPRGDTFVAGRVIPQMKVGSVRKMSIGYSTVEESWDGDIRDLKKLLLWETSLVTIPMNNEANITGMKSIDELKDVDERTMEAMFRSGVPFSQAAAKMLVSAVKLKFHRDDDNGDNRDGKGWAGVLTELESFKTGEQNDA